MRSTPRPREDIMLAYAFDPKRLKKYPLPWITQPKLNGDRCRAVFNEEGKVKIYSSTGLERTSVPHINERLESYGYKNFELDGELYVHGWTHQRIRSVVSRTVSLHPEYEKMEYHIFDIINGDPQRDRAHTLLRLDLLNNSKLIWVPTSEDFTIEHIEDNYKTFIDEGYEGIIIRHSGVPYTRKKTTTMMKLKPRVSAEATILGWEEEHDIYGQAKDSLGAFWLHLDDGTKFKVGTGFKRDQREHLWKIRQTLKGRRVKIRYQELSESGTPIMPSFERFL
jgi:DNA ligase 1